MTNDELDTILTACRTIDATDAELLDLLWDAAERHPLFDDDLFDRLADRAFPND